MYFLEGKFCVMDSKIFDLAGAAKFPGLSVEVLRELVEKNEVPFWC